MSEISLDLTKFVIITKFMTEKDFKKEVERILIQQLPERFSKRKGFFNRLFRKDLFELVTREQLLSSLKEKQSIDAQEESAIIDYLCDEGLHNGGDHYYLDKLKNSNGDIKYRFRYHYTPPDWLI